MFLSILMVQDKFDNLIWWDEIPKLYAERNNLNIKDAKTIVYSEYYKALYIEKIPMWTDVLYWFNRLKLGDWEDLLKKMKKYIYIYKDAKEIIKYLNDKYSLIIVSDANKNFLNIKLEKGN